MLDIQFIRENPSLVQKASIAKGININIDHVLEIDRKYRELQKTVQEIRAKRNVMAKEQNIEEGKKLKIQLEKEENALNAVGEELEKWLPWVHRFISNAKAWIIGTHHGVKSKYLKEYLAEYTYRFNRRHDPDSLFYRALQACTLARPVTCGALTG